MKRKADPTDLFRKCLKQRLPAKEGLTTTSEKCAWHHYPAPPTPGLPPGLPLAPLSPCPVEWMKVCLPSSLECSLTPDMWACVSVGERGVRVCVCVLVRVYRQCKPCSTRSRVPGTQHLWAWRGKIWPKLDSQELSSWGGTCGGPRGRPQPSSY